MNTIYIDKGKETPIIERERKVGKEWERSDDV